MGVLAATFRRPPEAERAARLVRERLGLGPGQVRLGRLGAAGRPGDGEPLIGVIVEDDRLLVAEALIEKAGGTIVETQWEHPSSAERAIDDRGS